MIDASSNTKYWYFIKLMGRDPSHLTLECALSTKPNYTIISEEVKHKDWDIEDIVNDIVRLVVKRHETGRNFGCILIPEGLPTFLPSINRIKTELDESKAKNEQEALTKMSAWAKARYEKLPDFIQKQLFYRDDSNELAVSQIETEKMLAYMVDKKLKELKNEGKYKGTFEAIQVPSRQSATSLDTKEDAPFPRPSIAMWPLHTEGLLSLW
jgi:6-phosphofructokinase